MLISIPVFDAVVLSLPVLPILVILANASGGLMVNVKRLGDDGDFEDIFGLGGFEVIEDEHGVLGEV